MSGRRQSRRNNTDRLRNRLVYTVSILVLTALVGAAFFSPGWIFGFQDNRQCSDTVLEERESVDVAVLSTNYESSFYQRMINFAESQAENANYYVASEEFTEYEPLQEFLYSEYCLYNDRIWTLIERELLTDAIFECQVSKWKQYVIYSDDYTKGVNFILWYIELEHPVDTMGTYQLLLEADTGELYGLRADTGGTPYATIYRKGTTYGKTSNYSNSLEDYINFIFDESYEEAWRLFAYLYSGLTESDFFKLYEYYYYEVDIPGKMILESGINDEGEMYYEEYYKELSAIKEKLGEEVDQWMDFLRTTPAMIVWDKGNRLECNFPYGESSLIFRLQMEESAPYPGTIHNITIGFPAIYELIPEFGTVSK